MRLKSYLFKVLEMNLASPIFIDHGFRFLNAKNITIDRYVSLGHDNHFWAFSKIHVGERTFTAKDLLVVAGSHDISSYEPIENDNVEIGAECWIGARVTILGGAKIGQGCVIDAGSLVRGHIPDWSVAVGVPAKVIRKRIPSERVWSQFGTYDSRIE